MPLLRRRPPAERLYREGWEAYDAGDHPRGIALVRQALEAEARPAWWFDLGLMHKWRQEWEPCLAANLEAARLDPSNTPACWNGGIAATALHDWPTARRLWAAYGVELPAGDGEPVEAIGTTPVRVGDDAPEVVWCTRLDPARARIENVPTPECGRRWGDVVLHDGVPNGERFDGRQWAPVFDEISVWRPSTVPHLRVRVDAARPAEVEALVDAVRDDGWGAEDWTGSVEVLCRACSESTMPSAEGEGEHLDPHDHSEPGHPGPLGHRSPGELWVPERECGIAAPAGLVRGLLDGWVADSPDSREWRDLEEVC